MKHRIHFLPGVPWVPLLLVGVLLVAAFGATMALAQRSYNPNTSESWQRQARPDMQVDRGDLPVWENAAEFKNDIFTFVRIRYGSYSNQYGRRSRGRWAVDYPDADLNFSYRLQQLTSLEVDPHGKVLELTDEELLNYPFIYLVEPGNMLLSPAEIQGLRRYLLNGGFLMVDDFWGEAEWQNFYYNIKQVFPEYEPVEIPLEHEIFHIVYDLKEKPQIPSIHTWEQQGLTYERHDGQQVHYRGLFDQQGRLMAIFCHNTDLGDGWEREGESPGYFREFSEKWAYPLGINIVVYAMTH